jgi:hypothetical protein
MFTASHRLSEALSALLRVHLIAQMKSEVSKL